MAAKRAKEEKLDSGLAGPPSSHPPGVFYAAAVLGLRALDARERVPRRFGADAEARWMQFAGALGVGDRIDILLRDAAGTWGAAFSPAECFGFAGLADDEPFGPQWPGIDDAAAKSLLAEPDAPATLDHVAYTLGVKGPSVPVPALTPATKLVIAGGAAIAAVAKAFADNAALSWTDQVVVVAENAAWRQLAGLAAVLLGARGRTVLVQPATDAPRALRAAGVAHIDAAVLSPDAEPNAAEFARSIGN
ncbi:MAG TPA: hypothetical protein VMM27_02985 [Casimicrobiaceae bacterium]|nr:hypothetical protein [Casimicrobiaceae bacterium]